jgi:hypothetical protein
MDILKTVKVSAYVIAAIAGVMSYGHQATLLLRAHAGLYSYAVPLTVDALAFIAALIRNSDDVTRNSRRSASATLILAGVTSIAANIAVGENAIQRIVGFWTVAAYLLAEWFVSHLKAKPAAEAVESAVVGPAAVEAPAVEAAPVVVEPAKPAADPEVFAKRSEAAKRGAATRAAKREAQLREARLAGRRERRAAQAASATTLATIEAAYATTAEDRTHINA